jgi:hypothetical protein
MKDIIKKILRESAGISFPVREWSKILHKEILSNPQEKTRLIVDGYDYPKAFEDFKVDYFVIDYHPTITGYGHDYSGIDKDGNYVVLLYLQPSIIKGNRGYSLITTLNHELKHAYQDYMRITSGYPSVGKSRESKELYTGDFVALLNNSGVGGQLKNILKDYYYLSDLETSAYLENVYDKNKEYERKVREIINKDYGKIKNDPNLDSDWYMITTVYDIPYLNKFKNPKTFIDKSSVILKNKAEKVLKKINKMKYVHGKL